MLRLESITFNHDPALSRGALNIRRNATAPVVLPEWRRGRSSVAADSPVAYALSRVDHQPLSVVAQFSRTSDDGPVVVRAVPDRAPLDPYPWVTLPNPQLLWPGGHWFSGWAEYAWYQWYDAVYRSWQERFARRPDSLGEVADTVVSFAPGDRSVVVRCPLRNVRLAARGVGVSDVAWRWQYRIGLGPWNELDVTHHRIYTVADVPTPPWVQQPAISANTQLPWVDALDVACSWAGGAFEARDAAEAITGAVFALGDGVLEYGCAISALTMYTSLLPPDTFDCTAFVERARGGTGNGPFVNCTDCASAVATLANLVGADLWESRMGEYTPAFETNPIQAIGGAEYESPCGWGLGFTYHEVAWTGDCRSDDFVYDACLRVSTESGVQGGVLPRHMRFGANGDGQYRDRIAAPLSRDICRPRPSERRRRIVV